MGLWVTGQVPECHVLSCGQVVVSFPKAGVHEGALWSLSNKRLERNVCKACVAESQVVSRPKKNMNQILVCLDSTVVTGAAGTLSLT